MKYLSGQKYFMLQSLNVKMFETFGCSNIWNVWKSKLRSVRMSECLDIWIYQRLNIENVEIFETLKCLNVWGIWIVQCSNVETLEWLNIWVSEWLKCMNVRLLEGLNVRMFDEFWRI